MTGGLERTKEEQVAEVLMAAQRRVKIVAESSESEVEVEINNWLISNRQIEILAFFPVAVAMATEISNSGPARVEVVSAGSNLGSNQLAMYTKEKYAVGIYYLDKTGGA